MICITEFLTIISYVNSLNFLPALNECVTRILAKIPERHNYLHTTLKKDKKIDFFRRKDIMFMINKQQNIVIQKNQQQNIHTKLLVLITIGVSVQS